LNEQLQAQARGFNQEVAQLRFKIQSLEHAQQQSEREVETRLEKVEAKSEELCLRARQEFAEEEESSLMRALLQLQVADDCMQTLRERHKQESDACAACRAELVQFQQQLAQETSACSRLRLSLSHAESEHNALSLKTQQLEDSIRSSAREGFELFTEAAKERRQTAAMVERFRTFGGASSDTVPAVRASLAMTPLPSEAQTFTFNETFLQKPSLCPLTGYSPSRLPAALEPRFDDPLGISSDGLAKWPSSLNTPSSKGLVSCLEVSPSWESSLGFALSPSKDISTWSALNSMGRS
jgi:hypothetical protein